MATRVASKCGTAFPCQHLGCGLGRRNQIHDRRSSSIFGHEYVSPEPEPYEPTLEERIKRLEERIEELENKIKEDHASGETKNSSRINP